MDTMYILQYELYTVYGNILQHISSHFEAAYEFYS